MALILLLLVLLTHSTQSEEKPNGPADSTIYDRINSILRHQYLPRVDTSFVDTTSFGIEILDVYSRSDTVYLLCIVEHDEEGFGDRNTRSLVPVLRMVGDSIEVLGHDACGAVSAGNLFSTGNRIYAEFTSTYGASGWVTEQYHLMQVIPGFVPSLFRNALYDHVEMDKIYTSYQFIKIVPEQNGVVSSALVWTVDLVWNVTANTLDDRRDSISVFALPQIDGRHEASMQSTSDSMKSMFLSSSPSIRYYSRKADSLLRIDYTGEFADPVFFESDSTIGQRLMQKALPFFEPALKTYSISQLGPRLWIEDLRAKSQLQWYKVRVRAYDVAQFELGFNTLTMQVTDSSGSLQIIDAQKTNAKSYY